MSANTGSVAIAINELAPIINEVVVDNGPFDITPPSFHLYDHTIWRFGDLTGAVTMTYKKTALVQLATDNQPIEEIHFPFLTSVVGENALTGRIRLSTMPNLVAATFPVLAAVDEIQIDHAPVLPSLDFPALTTCANGGFFCYNLDVCASVTASLLVSTVSNFEVHETNVTDLSFPSLTTVGGDIMCFINPLLTTVNFPLLVPTPGVTIDFQQCALTDTAVNAILAMCVANAAFTSGNVNLSLGTNSAPTGQGLLDVVTLTNRGVSVTVNP